MFFFASQVLFKKQTLIQGLRFEELCDGTPCRTVVVSFHCSIGHFHAKKGHYQDALQQRRAQRSRHASLAVYQATLVEHWLVMGLKTNNSPVDARLSKMEAAELFINDTQICPPSSIQGPGNPKNLCMVLWNMYRGGVNKLEMGLEILKLFQGVDLILLTETQHFPSQHLPHFEGFDSLAVVRTVQLGRTKAIKHSGGVVAYFRNHLNPNLSQWKQRNHNSYLWLRVNKGATPDLFVCVVYTAPIGSKHESKSLFQNPTTDTVEVQTLGGHSTIESKF